MARYYKRRPSYYGRKRYMRGYRRLMYKHSNRMGSGRGHQRLTKYANKIVGSKGHTPFPDNYFTKLNYSNYFYTGGSTSYDWIIRANSIFDPDYAYSSRTAYGYNRLATLYNYYRVTACAIKASITQVQTTNPNNAPVVFCVVPTITAALPTTLLDDTMSLPYCKWRQLCANNYNTTVISHYMTTDKIFGRKTGQESNFESGFGANPALQWYWHFFVKSSIPATLNAYVVMTVDITYYVRMHSINQHRTGTFEDNPIIEKKLHIEIPKGPIDGEIMMDIPTVEYTPDTDPEAYVDVPAAKGKYTEFMTASDLLKLHQRKEKK